jgi:hypothetical protein
MLTDLRRLDDDPNMIIVSGSLSTYKGDWSGSGFMNSALVTPAASRSLLQALADHEAQPQRLPYACAGRSDWDEIDLPGLQLKGWLVEGSPDRDGMDKHDPLAGGSGHRLTYPADDAVTAMRLATDHARIRYTDPADAIGARLHYWNEEDLFRHRSQTAYQSSGHYLAIRKDVLTDFLRNTGSSLVISVHASLYFSSRRERESIHHAATCYLLIHADGTEERLNAITS